MPEILQIMPVGAWILIALAVMMAGALLVDRINKRVRRFILSAAQDVADVLGTFAKSDNELRAWSKGRLLALEAQCRSLLAKSEELYSHTREDVQAAWQRIGRILSEKRGL